MTERFFSSLTIALLCGVCLSACGGGGSSSSNLTTPTSSNTVPTAAAGDDRSIDITTDAIVLDGSGSRDADGDSLSYSWQVIAQPDGVSVALSDGMTASPNFTSSVPGAYVFELTVTDGNGGTATDQVTITLVNQPPVASATALQQPAFVGSPVQFDASGSTDPNGHNLMYMWTIAGAPNDSGLLNESFSGDTENITFDAGGEYTIELSVTDGYDTTTLTLPPLQVDVFEVIPLSAKFADAEYDPVNKRFVALDGTRLTIIAEDGTESDVTLPLEGAAVSIQPAGNFAAISHNAFVSFVNLNTQTVLNTYPVTADIGGIVMDDAGYAHGFPATGNFVHVHTINMDTGRTELSQRSLLFLISKVKMHRNGRTIYGATRNVSPDDIERFTINNNTNVTRDYDSPYHGDYNFCGDLWMGPGGTTLISRCGVVLTTTDDRQTDLNFVMQINESIAHASSSDFNRAWNIIPTAADNIVKSYDADTGRLLETITLPDISTGAGRKWHPSFVFAENDSQRLNVLAVDDINNPTETAIIRRYAKPSQASDFAPTAITERYKTSRNRTNIVLDASQSTDPSGLPLSYEWMLVNEPNGSAITPTGLNTATVNFTPSEVGTYQFSLRVNNGLRQSAIKTIDVNVFSDTPDTPLVHRLEGDILDSEYSPALNAFVYLADDGRTLSILNMTDFSVRTVPLSRSGYQVGIAPNGTSAAVSHAGQATLIDLATAAITDTQSYSADWGDIVLGHNNRAYLVPNRDQWVDFYTLDFSADTVSQVFGARARTQLRMHPIENWVYGANRGLSPSDFEKWDVSVQTPARSVDSPYHGSYPISGNLWLSEDGDKILVAGGRLFNATSDPDTDMRYAGILSDNVFPKWADHSAEKDRWAVVSLSNRMIQTYSDDFHTLRNSFDIAGLHPNSSADDSVAEQVFFSDNGNNIYTLLKDETEADSYAIQITDYTTAD